MAHHLRPVGILERDRDLPEEPRGRRHAVMEVPHLREPHTPVLHDVGMHQRHAGLVQERRHRRAKIAARRLGERPPEIVGGGVSPLVLLEIREHTLAERLGPNPLLEHGEGSVPFLVCERVRGLEQVRHRFDRLADDPRGELRVHFHRLLHSLEGVRLHLEIGIDLPGDLDADPIGERFVEPKVVPPLHRHEVARIGGVIETATCARAALPWGTTTRPGIDMPGIGTNSSGPVAIARR